MFAGIILIWSWERKSGVEWSVECRRAVGKVVFNLITQSSRQSGPKVAGQLEFEAKRNESGGKRCRSASSVNQRVREMPPIDNSKLVSENPKPQSCQRGS